MDGLGCQYDENGTLLNSDCVESDVFYFNGSNGTGYMTIKLKKWLMVAILILDKYHFCRS